MNHDPNPLQASDRESRYNEFVVLPWFAVRNLDGAIDELSIYNAALPAVEVQELYESGKPVGY